MNQSFAVIDSSAAGRPRGDPSHAEFIELALLAAKELTNADGATLYLLDPAKNELRFEIFYNDALSTALGGTTGNPIVFAPLPLYDRSGRPNHDNVSTHVVLTGRSANIADVYDSQRFDFSGPKAFDAETGYRSASCLTVPIRTPLGEVLGAMQLVNARRPSGKVAIFPQKATTLVEALAAQVALALELRIFFSKASAA